MKRACRTFVIAVLTMGLAACEYDVKLLRVGSKNFTESELLGEMIAVLAEQQGIPVKRIIPYGDELDSMAAIQKGIIDVYPEYNGTALVLLGQPPLADSGAGWQRLKPVFESMELTWTTPFGFQNDYALVLTRQLSNDLGIASISDLAKLNEQGVRFATDETFPERPIDGLGALARRYGINQGEVKSFVVSKGGKAKIYEALLGGDVDVAEVYSTDGEIGHYDLVTLEDDLTFFPSYSAAPLVRNSALADFPRLASVLEKLGGVISEQEMRAMNFAVDFNGVSHKQVALEFLVKEGLVDESLLSGGTSNALTIAASHEDSSVAGATSKAWSAVRKVFSQREVNISYVNNPVDSVLAGEARLGIATSESLFTLDGGQPVLRPGIDVIGGLGYKAVHLVAGKSGPDDIASIQRLGTGLQDGPSDRAARMMLTSLGLTEAVEIVHGKPGNDGAQFDLLRSGDIDGLLVLAEVGDGDIDAQLKGGDLRLLSIPQWSEGNNTLRFAFLRPTKISKDTYSTQSDTLDTATVQSILVSPVELVQIAGTHGPVSVEVSPVSPIAPGNVVKLNQTLKDLTGSAERIDPVLPVSAALKRSPAEEFSAITPQIDVTLVNLLFLIMMGLMYGLYRKEKPSKRG